MRVAFILSVVLLLSACQANHHRTATASQQGMSGEAAGPVLMPPNNSYQSHYTHKAVRDYAAQIAMDLMQSMGAIKADDRLAVVSFVELDERLRTGSVLGNQLAEKLIAEMQTYGIELVDYKATGYIEVTPRGDWVFSRDFRELASHQEIDYVLAGTLSRSSRGVDVSSRVISLKERAVIATASNFIPAFVVADLQPRLTAATPLAY